MDEEEFLRIEWPDEFTVVYTDGTSESLLRGSGVNFLSSDDSPDGNGGLLAELTCKSEHSKKQIGRFVAFTEISELLYEDGRAFWKRG